MAIERRQDRFRARDLVELFRNAQTVELRMAVGVVAQQVSLIHDAPHQVRMLLGLPADGEERGTRRRAAASRSSNAGVCVGCGPSSKVRYRTRRGGDARVTTQLRGSRPSNFIFRDLGFMACLVRLDDCST